MQAPEHGLQPVVAAPSSSMAAAASSQNSQPLSTPPPNLLQQWANEFSDGPSQPFSNRPPSTSRCRVQCPAHLRANVERFYCTKGKNQGRYFYRCNAFGRGPAQCQKLFVWADEAEKQDLWAPYRFGSVGKFRFTSSRAMWDWMKRHKGEAFAAEYLGSRHWFSMPRSGC